MLNVRATFEPDDVKTHIEYEIKKDQKSGIDIKVAEKLLGVRAIDKAYDGLKKRAVETQFQFQPERASQELRPYQEQTLERLDELLEKQFTTIAVQLPTGAGKTFLIHSFTYDRFLTKNRNVLIVTPSWEIAHQHAMTLVQHFRDGASRVRRLGGRGQLISLFDEFKPGSKGKAIITTSALYYARRESLSRSLKASLVIIDEGHHGWKKKRLNSVLSFARELKAPSILLTATPPQNMENLPFAAQLSYLDLVPEYLVPCDVIRIDTGEEFAPVLKNGVLTQSSRVEISSRQGRFEKIVAQSIPNLKGQTIYYAGSVNEAMGVVAEFKKQKISAVVVHSKWAKKGEKINALAIDRFRKGEVQVLVNVQMLAMGFDVPNVETIIVARPVESDTLFTQMVGRGARPSDGKTSFRLIDVHDTISKPDVAKIFEHKHLFYGGPREEEAPPPPEVLETPDVNETLATLPWSRNGVVLNFDSFHFLRSSALIGYFIDPDRYKFEFVSPILFGDEPKTAT